MSYILDALKKAEKERMRNAPPEPARRGETESRAPGKRPRWTYLLFAALLVNACILLWLLGPWTQKSPITPARKSEVNTPARPVEMVKESFDMERPIDSLPQTGAKPGGIQNEIKKGRGQETETRRISATEKNNESPGPLKTKPHLNKEAQAKAKPDERHEKAETVRGTPLKGSPAEHISPDHKQTAGDGDRLYKINDLPQPVLSNLPDLSLSLHLYNTEPSSRLISVKGKTLREGQELAPGLKLEEITRSGAVFSFEHYRFQVGITAN